MTSDITEIPLVREAAADGGAYLSAPYDFKEWDVEGGSSARGPRKRKAHTLCVGEQTAEAGKILPFAGQDHADDLSTAPPDMTVRVRLPVWLVPEHHGTAAAIRVRAGRAVVCSGGRLQLTPGPTMLRTPGQLPRHHSQPLLLEIHLPPGTCLNQTDTGQLDFRTNLISPLVEVIQPSGQHLTAAAWIVGRPDLTTVRLLQIRLDARPESGSTLLVRPSNPFMEPPVGRLVPRTELGLSVFWSNGECNDSADDRS